MKKIALSSIAIFALIWVFLPRIHSATAKPETDLEITFSIWPLQSLHSDWHRKVSIDYRGARIEKRLFEDTGWWRGSNLYIHNSGTYVVHEGQNGCFAFTVEPTEFVEVPNGVCAKQNSLVRSSDQSSLYYRGLKYLGHFQETYRNTEGVRIRFLEPSHMPEVDLPEIL